MHMDFIQFSYVRTYMQIIASSYGNESSEHEILKLVKNQYYNSNQNFWITNKITQKLKPT